jgi:hypothetical protein
MIFCPQCNAKHHELDFDEVMDVLSKNPNQGECTFSSKCCDQQLRAFSNGGIYYLDGNSNSTDVHLTKPQQIGAN